MSNDPSDEKANPQTMPDIPSSPDDHDDKPEIEDPEIRSGHRFGPTDDDSAPDKI